MTEDEIRKTYREPTSEEEGASRDGVEVSGKENRDSETADDREQTSDTTGDKTGSDQESENFCFRDLEESFRAGEAYGRSQAEIPGAGVKAVPFEVWYEDFTKEEE